jgi:hypothetical protein
VVAEAAAEVGVAIDVPAAKLAPVTMVARSESTLSAVTLAPAVAGAAVGLALAAMMAGQAGSGRNNSGAGQADLVAAATVVATGFQCSDSIDSDKRQ